MPSSTSFVLIPGAGGSAWYWHLVEPQLRRLGHDVVSVDLPAADETAGLDAYTEAVVRAIGDRRELVIVGQSMGGFTAPLVTQHLPVSLLVLVNAMIPTSGETGGDWWSNTGQVQARRECDRREGRDPDGPFDVVSYFFHDVPPAVAEQAMAVELPQSERPFADPWPLPAWPGVPTRVLTAREDRFFPAEFQRRVAVDRLGLEPDLITGGHLVALSNPVELADRLAGYLG